MNLSERFLSKIKRDPSGCWLWTAGKTTAGYGNLSVGGNMVYAHRAAYELYVGPIPEGLTIDHLCRNTLCVNPAHLEAVTMRENILRGTGPSAQAARKTHCLRGHPFDDGNTLFRATGKRVCRACQRVHREKRRDKDIARHRAWREANREHVIAYKRGARQAS